MSDTVRPDNGSDLPWSANEQRARVPDTSMAPGSEKAAPPAVGLLKSAVQGAHHTIDRLADSAAPAVRQLGSSVEAAGESLHARADQLRDTRDEWAEGVRTTVRANPLVSLTAAFALGALIARITR